MDSTFILPWQQDIWQSLLQRRQQERMPHALLFSGSAGVGKMQFANALAASMLCAATEASGKMCGNCKSCHLIAAHAHPDYLQILPEEKGQVIKIDQIRAVVDFVNSTALLGGYRIIIINPAAAMNVYAANALLKTLEEPSAKTLLILISHQGGRLPATIVSRCQRIVFHRPQTASALQWLQQRQSDRKIDLELVLNLANGAPLKAQEYLENDILTLRNNLYQGLLELSQRRNDPLQMAAAWLEQDKAVLIYWLLLWLNDLLRCKTTDAAAPVVNTDKQADLQNLAQRISLQKLLKYIEHVQQVYARATGTINLNQQLLLEETLIEWTLCF